MIETRNVEEATCSVCGTTWIRRDEASQACPECRRKSSEVTKTLKNRHLCICCHHVWMKDSLVVDTFCPKCNKVNEENKRVVTYDRVSVYTCGACGNEWVEDAFNFELGKDGLGNSIFLSKAIYCQKCGCGREEALEEKRKHDDKSRKRSMRGGGYSSYRGHTQTTDLDTGEWTPSKEEIDARIAAGIWKDETHKYRMWNAQM